MSGWYIMRRGWMDGFKPEPFTEREAFLWSIEQAAWEDHDQWFNGQKIAVRRGEFVTSLSTMAAAFGWTIKRVRGLMERLGKSGNWAQRLAHDGAQSPTIVTVVNYSKYQELPRGEGTASGTDKGTRGAQQGHSGGTQQNRRKPQVTAREQNPADSLPAELNDTSSESAVSALQLVPRIASLPVIDEVAQAFAEFDAMRRSIVDGARDIQLSPDRRQKLAARLREIGGLGEWRNALTTIRGSPFLRGEKSRDGRMLATIDWVIEPKNLRKIREGNFDDRPSSGRGVAASASPLNAMRAARAANGLG